jgi:peptidoglycan hydrolase-like protein with peptidoglycan-binding domain
MPSGAQRAVAVQTTAATTTSVDADAIDDAIALALTDDSAAIEAAVAQALADAGAPAQAFEGVRVLNVGSSGPAVQALQDALAGLRYAVNTDGQYTEETKNAVMAFQKINGLDRDGVAGRETFDALQNPVGPQLGEGLPDRVDVDLSTQTLTVVRDGQIDYILNATTGNPNHPDGQGIATPTGTFAVEWKYPGTRRAALGELYYPSYFSGPTMPATGIAVHGGRMGAAEASHGCVRVPREHEQRIFNDMPVGSQVVVHQ